MSGKAVKTTVSMPEELKEYAKKNEISLSAVIQEQLRTMKDPNSDESQFKYTPNAVLREGRKQGLITMLSGVFILIVMFLGYMWLTTGLSGFVVAWLAGSGITYYGAREYSKWNDILYYRSQAEKSQEESNERDDD